MDNYKHINKELVGQVQEMRLNIGTLQREVLTLRQQLLDERQKHIEEKNLYIALFATKFCETMREICPELNIAKLVERYEDDAIEKNTSDFDIQIRNRRRCNSDNSPKTISLCSRKSTEILKTLQQSNNVTQVRRSVRSMSPRGSSTITPNSARSPSLNSSSPAISRNITDHDSSINSDAMEKSQNDNDDEEDEVELVHEISEIEQQNLSKNLSHIIEEDSFELNDSESEKTALENTSSNSSSSRNISVTSSPLSDLTNSPLTVYSTRKRYSFRNKSINVMRHAEESLVDNSLTIANLSNILNLPNKSKEQTQGNNTTMRTADITFNNVSCSTPRNCTILLNQSNAKKNIYENPTPSASVGYSRVNDTDENCSNSSTRPRRCCTKTQSYKEVSITAKQRNENLVKKNRKTPKNKKK